MKVSIPAFLVLLVSTGALNACKEESPKPVRRSSGNVKGSPAPNPQMPVANVPAPVVDSKPVGSSPQPMPPVAGAGTGTGTGTLTFPSTWTACQVLEGGGSVKGFASVLTMEAAGKVVIQESMHPDSSCASTFSNAQMEQMALESNPDLATAPADEKKAVLDAYRASFKVTKNGVYVLTQDKNAEGEQIGTMDLETEFPGVKAYTSFAVAGSGFRYLSTCVKEELDEERCDRLAGESALNRAKDFENLGAIVLTKK